MDELEIRREARRRKILENSERRLKKISGVEQKTTKTEIDDFRLNASYKNEANPSSLISNNNAENSIPKLETKSDSIFASQNITTSSSSEIKTIFRNPKSVENESVSTCYIDVVARRNYRNLLIFILPITLSFILVMCDYFQTNIESLYLNKIFAPLLAYELVEYFFCLSPNNSSSFITSLLLLSNLRGSFVTAYISYIQYFLKIMQDVLVYFFVFILSHSLFKTIL